MEPRPDGVPRRIGSYEVLGLIAEGTTSAVYHARNPLLGREVAVKLCGTEALAGGREALNRRRFLTGAKIAGKLRHPHIVEVCDAGFEGDRPFLVMELLERGRPVMRYTSERSGLLPVADAVRIVKCCAEALHYAHRHGVVHRDIKPRNILVDAELEPKITDFGVAFSTRAGDTMTQLAGAGTPLYMSPEQILEQPVGHHSDLFSLAVVLYELLAGRNPFRGESLSEILANVVNKPPAPLAAPGRDLPPELAAILERALEKDPERRHPTALDLAAELERVLGQLTTGGGAASEQQRFERARELAFFHTFSEGEVREAVADATLEPYRAGETVIAPGDASSCFYLLVEGEVTIRREARPFTTLGRGECFGEVGAVTGRARTATAVVTSPSALVLRVPAALLRAATPGCQLRLKDGLLGVLTGRISAALDLVA